MVTAQSLRVGHAVVRPTVLVGGNPLSGRAMARLLRVVADLSAHVPDMVELTFADQTGDVLGEAGLAIGTRVQVRAGATRERSDWEIVDAEVTSIEGRYGDADFLTVVRGYTADHRLQRGRRSESYPDAKDSAVATQIARRAGLTVGTVDATTPVHASLVQAGESDWDFLARRAAAIGYEFGVREGTFHFRAAATVAAPGTPLAARLGDVLTRFEPRVSAAGLTPEFEARAHDPAQAKAVAVAAATPTVGVDIGAGTAAKAAAAFAPEAAPAAAAASELGPAPKADAHAATDITDAITSGNDQLVRQSAEALARHAAAGFADADGELLGDGRVAPGTVLKVSGVPTAFAGTWLVTSARHVFDNNERGYRVRFTAGGGADRSLLALTGDGGRDAAHGGSADGRAHGVVCGVVTDVKDPLALGRVKVALPWLSPLVESAWAPVTQLFAGTGTGALFLPQPKDQVLVAFEHGDVRRPYVLGSLVNERTGTGFHLDGGSGTAKPGAAAIGSGQPAPVVRRGLVSPAGNRIVLHDEVPPSGGKPTSAQIVLATPQDKVSVVLDQVAGTIAIRCAPGSPPGAITIESDGDIEVKAGANGRLTVDGGQQLTLKGQKVAIEGTTVDVTGTAAVAVKGKPIQLN